jgi:hypothetical protein
MDFSMDYTPHVGKHYAKNRAKCEVGIGENFTNMAESGGTAGWSAPVGKSAERRRIDGG